MMIIGVGVDLCRVESIRRSVDHFGKDWLDEVFTEEEQALLRPGQQLAQWAAIGFSLKEACAKAIGTGFAKGVRRQDFIVTVDDSDYSIRLAGAARRHAVKLCGASALVQLQTHVRSTTRWVNALAVLESDVTRIPISIIDVLPVLPN